METAFIQWILCTLYDNVISQICIITSLLYAYIHCTTFHVVLSWKKNMNTIKHEQAIYFVCVYVFFFFSNDRVYLEQSYAFQ